MKELSHKLFEWTDERWIISFSKSEGEISVKDKQKNKQDELFKSIKNSEIYNTVIKRFPDAQLLDVKINKKKD